MEADGDQVLFDVNRPGSDAEYPVMYYAHEAAPPAVRHEQITVQPGIGRASEALVAPRLVPQGTGGPTESRA